MSSPPDLPMNCPRCGYDLRGEVDTWRDACPLAGTCSECGLRLRWGTVLDPDQRLHKWHVEHATGWWRLAIAVVFTFGRTLLPWRFWRVLQMEHPVRPRRFILFAVALLFFLHVDSALVAAVDASSRRWGGLTAQRRVEYGTEAAFNMFVRFECWSTPYTVWVGTRIANSWRRSLRLNPLSLVIAPARTAYGLPGLVILTAAILPLSYALLPQTFRQAKVRCKHLLRIGVYSLTFIPAMLYPLVLFAESHIFWTTPALVPTLAWGSLLMLIAWWGFACSRYLRLPSPWAIALTMTLLSTLLALALLLALDLLLVVI